MCVFPVFHTIYISFVFGIKITEICLIKNHLSSKIQILTPPDKSVPKPPADKLAVA
jgi:hypothetical protein